MILSSPESMKHILHIQCQHQNLQIRLMYITQNYNILAYIDDTFWIANSQTQLDSMLETTQSFYKMAKIKVNSDKSVLATNENFKTIPNQMINFEQQNI